MTPFGSIATTVIKDGVWGWVVPLADRLKNSSFLGHVEMRAGRDDDECHMVFTKTTFLRIYGPELGENVQSSFHPQQRSSKFCWVSDRYFHEWNLG